MNEAEKTGKCNYKTDILCRFNKNEEVKMFIEMVLDQGWKN